MRIRDLIISHKRLLFLSSISFVLYVLLGFIIERHETLLLLSSFAVLFIVYYAICTKVEDEHINHWLFVAILLRVLFVFTLPRLSDDFYRFIWDGRLLVEGIHPFAEIPSFYLQEGNTVATLTHELFQQLNSKEYFTIYPPIAQFIFWFASILSPSSIIGSVVIMKLLVVLAEVGTLWVLTKLLLYFKLPPKKIVWYALNPLIILELTGNLHFEAFVIFFLLASFYLLLKERQTLSALLFSLAVCVKLIPLIFLPSLLPYLGIRKASYYYLIVMLTSSLLFIPLVDIELLRGFNESLGYYFKKFEFNASIYYLLREWGFWKYGYNIVQTVGWKLALLSTAFILVYTFRNSWQKKIIVLNQNVLRDWMIILVLYLLFTTTVHPWYITPLLAFCIFGKFRFPILWSLLIFGSYFGYSVTSYQENLWITAIEYGAVLLLLVVEIRKEEILVNR